MNAPHLQEEMISLLSGEVDVATLAARHAVTDAEVLQWRAAFIAGMRASSHASSGRARRLRFRWVAVAAMVVGTAAFAQLTVFTPNSPALASEVNGNFNQLKAWLEAKVGPVTNSNITTSGSVSAGSVNTGSVTTSGTVTAGMVSPSYFAPLYAAWNTTGFTGGAGIVNDNASYRALMIAGNTSAGGARKVNIYDDAYVSGDLAVNGNGWGSHINTGWTNFSIPTASNGSYIMCANGAFMCGLQVGHVANDTNYWTGVNIAIHCCTL